ERAESRSGQSRSRQFRCAVLGLSSAAHTDAGQRVCGVAARGQAAQTAGRAHIPKETARSPGCAEVVAASPASHVERHRTAITAHTALDRPLNALVGFAGTVVCAWSERR